MSTMLDTATTSSYRGAYDQPELEDLMVLSNLYRTDIADYHEGVHPYLSSLKSKLLTQQVFAKQYMAKNTSSTFEETLPEEEYPSLFYESESLVEKMIRLKENLGIRLFRKLSHEQVMLMVKTAGAIRLDREIDISAVYNYIENYDYE